jgi:hypothetical protein
MTRRPRRALALSLLTSGETAAGGECVVLWSTGALGCRLLALAHPSSLLSPICLHTSGYGLSFGKTWS